MGDASLKIYVWDGYITVPPNTDA